MKHIVFVCSGNTCRSPLAEGIARRLLAQRGVADVTVSSAGTSALDGMPASPEAVEVARSRGLDLDGHLAQTLGATHVREADLIIAMGAGHRERVGAIDPDALEYTHLITSYSPTDKGDVPDPIGGGTPAYEETYELVNRCVEGMVSGLDDYDGWKAR